MLSVIIPSYNEEKCIRRIYHTINTLLTENNIDSEFIFVDDGSQDQTYQVITELSMETQNVVGLHFSRNFGKESAISAGLAATNGDCAVVIDCDLQHPPEKIIEMYRLWEEGYEIIEGIKKERGEEKKLHSIGAKLFYSVISHMAGFDMANSSDFKLLDRKVVDVLNQMPERGFFRAISYWVGYNKTTVEYDVRERVDGESKWSTRGLIKYALSNISSYSTAPMQIVTALGVVMLIISVIFGVWALIDKIIGRALEGMTTVIIITIFIGSIIMISLGIIGYYIARIYEEIKGRPKYIISSTVTSTKKTAIAPNQYQ
ncbi:MAG: glycosyltransferase family 2 protein [Ruminococcaceae bacterium]|nr:glycosyltransferase family 2 protein [Oscillospiraceae bacterium]